jgi:sialate O-acetylesterase
LVVKDDRLGEFSTGGQVHQWHWADTKTEGDTVVVTSLQVLEPEAVRYAWQSFPAATLYKGAGLPAVPFRTDN